MQILLDKSEAVLNKHDHEGDTALTTAAFGGNREILSILLDGGVDPSVPHLYSKQTAVHQAVMEGDLDLKRNSPNVRLRMR